MLNALVPDFSSNPLVKQNEMESLLGKGYFTINNHIYRFDSNKWAVGMSLNDEEYRDKNISLDFSAFDDKAKPVVMLWMYFELNPYKETGTCKIRTIRHKLTSLRQCYLFLKAENLVDSFLSPSYLVAEKYRNHLKENYRYHQQVYKSRGIYAYFLRFVEEFYHIEQNEDAIDLLSSIDAKKSRAEQIARSKPPMSPEFFTRLYNLCINAVQDEQAKPEDRIIASILVLLSQTGLRKDELLNIKNQEIQSIATKEDNGKPIEIKYIYANIHKEIRGRDTRAIKCKIPLTEDAEQAYLFLVDNCKEARERLKSDLLIVFLTQKSKYSRIDTKHYFTPFYLHYHKELHNINVQNEYPELSSMLITPAIKNFSKDEYDKLVEEYHTDNLVLSYPVFHQFRKSFATNLYQKGHTVEIISKLLHHSSTDITSTYYVKPQFNAKDYATTKKTYNSIIKHKSSVLGKKSADFTKRLQEYIDNDEVASICTTDDELIDYMSKNHPLHAKDVGFCLLSDIYPCTVRTDEERMMCAFNTCPNLGFMFYDLVEHYRQMKNYETSIELNRQEGLELAAQKEMNKLKYLVKTFIVPEIIATDNEIVKHGQEKLIEWYPELSGILNRFNQIKQEVEVYQKKIEEIA